MDNQEVLINEVKVKRSLKRRKTIGAKMVGGALHVFAPQFISEEYLNKAINNFKKRFERKRLKTRLNREYGLDLAAQALNKRYFSGGLKINSIEYVTGQNKRFGSCDYIARNIRISHVVQAMPDWVRDYVLIHEMAHLIEPNHSRAFWDIISRYRLAERARGYLIAKGFEIEEERHNGME